MTITTNQIHVAARGLYALHLAQNGREPGRGTTMLFDDLASPTRVRYYAKAERILYDLAYSDCRLSPKALEEVFND